MVYKLVNSKRIIGKIFDEYNIDYSGFISRVPAWIFSAMSKMNIKLGYLSKTVDGQVTDYKALIPDECKKLEAVTYKGYRLPRLGRINESVSTNMDGLYHEDFKYELDNNGYIITTFESCDLGDIKFHIKYFPLELDTETNLYFPLIPEDEHLFTALQSYILMMLLQRGHKVGNLSFEKNNEMLNPMISWKLNSRKAKNSVNRLDLDGKEEISKMVRSFLQDYNYYTQDAINYKEKES